MLKRKWLRVSLSGAFACVCLRASYTAQRQRLSLLLREEEARARVRLDCARLSAKWVLAAFVCVRQSWRLQHLAGAHLSDAKQESRWLRRDASATPAVAAAAAESEVAVVACAHLSGGGKRRLSSATRLQRAISRRCELAYREQCSLRCCSAARALARKFSDTCKSIKFVVVARVGEQSAGCSLACFLWPRQWLECARARS